MLSPAGVYPHLPQWGRATQRRYNMLNFFPWLDLALWISLSILVLLIVVIVVLYFLLGRGTGKTK